MSRKWPLGKLFLFISSSLVKILIVNEPEANAEEVISDEMWKQIIANKVNPPGENYTIGQGDSLSEISRKLLGDIKYWPKLWAINNQGITNPHRIRPGQTVTFSLENQ